MADRVDIVATLSRADLIRLLNGAILWRRRSLYIVPLVLSAIVIGAFVARSSRPWPAGLAVASLCVGYAIIFVCMMTGTATSTAFAIWRLKPDGTMLEAKRISVDREAITCVGMTITHRTAWQAVDRLQMHDFGLEFVLNEPRHSSLLIPRRALDDAALVTINRLYDQSRA